MNRKRGRQRYKLGRQAHRQSDRQTNKGTHTRTNRTTDRQTDRQFVHDPCELPIRAHKLASGVCFQANSLGGSHNIHLIIKLCRGRPQLGCSHSDGVRSCSPRRNGTVEGEQHDAKKRSEVVAVRSGQLSAGDVSSLPMLLSAETWVLT
jgi:hypothetical protein